MSLRMDVIRRKEQEKEFEKELEKEIERKLERKSEDSSSGNSPASSLGSLAASSSGNISGGLNGQTGKKPSKHTTKTDNTTKTNKTIKTDNTTKTNKTIKTNKTTKTDKTNNKNRKNILIATVGILVMILASVGIYAAYTSRSYVKGVATTPKNALLLYSDYLSAISGTAEVSGYPARKILLEEKDSGDYVISFYIQNMNGNTVSSKNMRYTLKMDGLVDGITVKTGANALDGTDITSLVTGASGYVPDVMPAYEKTVHYYTLTIPYDKLNEARNIVVTAVPDKDSDSSGNILAARLQPSITGTVAAFSYRGEFLDQTAGNFPYDFAAFNYDISVTNANEDHTMKLSWDNTKVELDPLFIQDMGGSISTSGTSSSFSFVMNSDNSNYIVKFYRMEGRDDDDAWQATWGKLEEVISFEEAN